MILRILSPPSFKRRERNGFSPTLRLTHADPGFLFRFREFRSPDDGQGDGPTDELRHMRAEKRDRRSRQIVDEDTLHDELSMHVLYLSGSVTASCLEMLETSYFSFRIYPNSERLVNNVAPSISTSVSSLFLPASLGMRSVTKKSL